MQGLLKIRGIKADARVTAERLRQQSIAPEEVWKALPGPQTLALACEADELFFGGRAGGGKSDLLLGCASTFHTKSIIFRREYPQLREIVERSSEILDPVGARYNGTAHLWRNIPGNRLLEFGAVQRDRDVRKYRGRPHDFIGFDEIPEFTEFQYRFLGAWLRTTVKGQRVRKLVTGNPPSTSEGRWVVKYWAPWLDETYPNPAEPGELRWFAMIDGEDTEVDGPVIFTHNGELIEPISRSFIPASLVDNPYLYDTNYARQLRNLPEPLRSQLLKGDFTIEFDEDPWLVIPLSLIKRSNERWARGRGTQALSKIGVDVARGGKDQTVLAKRYGTWIAPLEKHAGKTTPDGPSVAALCVNALRAEKDASAINEVNLNIDIIGVGGSAYDTGLALGLRMVPINNAEKSRAKDRSGRLSMKNVRAEGYWAVREALENDELDLPPDPELTADLTSPRWSLTISGIQVESKKDIVARLKRSPDCSDAVVNSILERRFGKRRAKSYQGAGKNGRRKKDMTKLPLA